MDKPTEELINNLARPIFNYRRARAMLDHPNEAQRRGAKKRCDTAALEIDQFVRDYISKVHPDG